jgi:hypothetical protein
MEDFYPVLNNSTVTSGNLTNTTTKNILAQLEEEKRKNQPWVSLS